MGKSVVFAVTNDILPDRRMHRICDTLQQEGYDVTLVGRELPQSNTLPAYRFSTHRIKCMFKRGPGFYAEYNIRLNKYLRRIKPEIFAAVDYDTLKGVVRAGRKLKGRIVFDAHEWFEEVPELEGRIKVKRYWQKIARQSLPHTDLRFAVSEGIASALHDTYHQPFEVIHNFPLLSDQEPSAIRDDIIVYVGVLNKGRGLEAMIKSMHEINAVLWLIGTGDIEQQLRTLVVQEQLSHKVLFKGFVLPEQLSEYLWQARIGINLLDQSSKSYKYSLANKFFDYVHAGVPQVTMDFPEYHRFNQQHRVAALIGDLKESSIVYAINHLLDDRNYWFTYHTTCLEARQDWNWQKEAPKLLSLFKNL